MGTRLVLVALGVLLWSQPTTAQERWPNAVIQITYADVPTVPWTANAITFTMSTINQRYQHWSFGKQGWAATPDERRAMRTVLRASGIGWVTFVRRTGRQHREHRWAVR